MEKRCMPKELEKSLSQKGTIISSKMNGSDFDVDAERTAAVTDIPKNVRMHNTILTKISETYIAKNHDYGNSFGDSIEKFGLVASAVRISDKFNRFCTLIKKPTMVKDESIEDTLLDMANYAIMTVMEIRKRRGE